MIFLHVNVCVCVCGWDCVLAYLRVYPRSCSSFSLSLSLSLSIHLSRSHFPKQLQAQCL